MAYLAVNKDGCEYIFEHKPTRNNDGYWCTAFYTLDKYDSIEDAVSPYIKSKIRELGIELPNGSIEKLISKKLTWDNEPINI